VTDFGMIQLNKDGISIARGTTHPRLKLRLLIVEIFLTALDFNFSKINFAFGFKKLKIEDVCCFNITSKSKKSQA